MGWFAKVFMAIALNLVAGVDAQGNYLNRAILYTFRGLESVIPNIYARDAIDHLLNVACCLDWNYGAIVIRARIGELGSKVVYDSRKGGLGSRTLKELLDAHFKK